MRYIDEIIIHCSASPEGKDVTAEDIDRLHLSWGWRDCGYHFVIELDGSIHSQRPIEQIGAHTVGHNQNSIGICYIGGMNKEYTHSKDTRTPEQKKAILELVKSLLDIYPTIKIISPHSKYANKACPSFNVYNWLNENGLEKYIWK